MMKLITLVITVTLAVPAYAQPSITDCDVLEQASDTLTYLIKDSKNKTLPLSDDDKLAMKQAIEAFEKAVKNYYEIKDPPIKKKKHSALGTIGRGLGAIAGSLGSSGGGYYGGGGGGGMQSMMTTTYMTPSGFVNVTPMGFNSYAVNGTGFGTGLLH